MEQKPGESKKPNLFIVGAAKSGTTSLYHYLSQHPEIYFSPLKEPHYFSYNAIKFPRKGPGDEISDANVVKDWQEYLKLFENAQDEKIIAEASVDYLYYHAITIPLIYEHVPEAKILILLRNPSERAFSAYRHMFKDKRETLSFENAIVAEESRIRDNYGFIWFYKELGFYHDQVKGYMNTFGEGYVKVCLLDDLEKNPHDVIKNIFKFLEVDDYFKPDIEIKYNTSKLNKFGTLYRFFNNYDHPVKNALRPIFFSTIGKGNTSKLFHYVRDKFSLDMKPETRKYLTDLYREDILKLQDLIDRDLSEWM